MSNAVQARIQSVDILRGAIMVLMAIDHVRVYSGVPAGSPEPAIFFTRWITHFCAPGFVFFTGLSAFLYGQKVKNKNALSRFLLTRGILLVLLELTFIRFCWTFNFNFSNFTLAGVIWMLGWCMVIMAVLVRLRAITVGIVGLLIIFGQQLFSYVPKIIPSSIHKPFGYLWEFVYPSGLEALPGFTILYVLVPWIGVMAAGYGFGLVITKEAKQRNKICWWVGIGSILIFLIAGSIMTSLNEVNEDAPPFLLRLLNQNKYPASQLYLLMTLGPLIALIPYSEKAKGWFANTLSTFGNVPMFYYLLHIPLIHVSALLANQLLRGDSLSRYYQSAPYTWFENDPHWNLGLLYLVFFLDVALLYFACRWYSKYKAAHPEKKWLKYI